MRTTPLSTPLLSCLHATISRNLSDSEQGGLHRLETHLVNANGPGLLGGRGHHPHVGRRRLRHHPGARKSPPVSTRPCVCLLLAVSSLLSLLSPCAHQSLTCHLLHQVVDGNWGAHVAIPKHSINEKEIPIFNLCRDAGSARPQVLSFCPPQGLMRSGPSPFLSDPLCTSLIARKRNQKMHISTVCLGVATGSGTDFIAHPAHRHRWL